MIVITLNNKTKDLTAVGHTDEIKCAMVSTAMNLIAVAYGEELVQQNGLTAITFPAGTKAKTAKGLEGKPLIGMINWLKQLAKQYPHDIAFTEVG